MSSLFLAWVGRIPALAVLVVLGLFAVGCAAQQAPDATRELKMPWWVASPSAPLPAGFPEPSPPEQIVVKEYPAYRAALVRSDAKGQGANSMFYPLFNHIEKNHVAMSSPVEITYDAKSGDAPASMAFIYGDPSIGKAGKDENVEVVDVPAMRVASVGITGSYTDKRFEQAYVRLSAWLKEHPEYEEAGRPRYLAYNSPFVLPFMRYGEVQVPIRGRAVPGLRGAE